MSEPPLPYRPRPLCDPPPALVEGGRFQLGTYRAPLRRVNPLDAAIDGPLGLPWPRALKRARLKEWQHFALASPDYYLSLAIFDAKLLCLGQVCLYDRRAHRTIFHEQKALSRQAKLPDELWDARASLLLPGLSLEIHNHLEQGAHHIRFHAAARGGPEGPLPELRGAFTCASPLPRTEPLVVCLPFEEGRAMYSHKQVAEAEGELEVEGRAIRFGREESYALIDVHKGYYPFEMIWRWATAAGRDDQNRLIGFNLTDNQVRNQDQYNENCLWLDGRLHLLPPVRFFYGEATDLSRSWRIEDRHGQVSLTFTPEALRRVDLDLGLFASRYRGPFGTFSGWIRDAEGKKRPIERCFGMCEDFYLRV